ncbi:MAG: B12-binding domain-containing radical SAM protein [Promethearchaeota archaeon]
MTRRKNIKPGPHERVLLVKPSGSSGLAFALNPIPLGIESIAAYLRERLELEDILIFDQFMEPAGAFPQVLQKFRPDIVGFSMSATEHNSGGEMMALVRRHDPSVPIIAGGFHPTGGPEIVLRELDCDAVVRGEGEGAFLDLVRGEEWSGIDGLSYWDRDTGEVVHNPDRDPIRDLDELPFPARDLRKRRGYDYKNNLLIDRVYDQMEFGRGCYGLCTFCCEPYFSRGRMRYKSPAWAMEEVRAIWEFHGRKPLRVLIGDPHIMGRPAAVSEFCDLLIEADLDITFQVMSRTEMVVKHPEVAEKMIRAGMISWEVGVESPKQEDLDITNKHVDLSVQNEGIRILRDLGGEVLGTFVVGLPHHTPEFVKRFPDYARAIGLAAAAFGVATPFPGTGFWKELERDGLIFERDWAKYDENHMTFHHPTMSPEDVEHLRNWCLARFWNLDSIVEQFRLDQIRVGKFRTRHKIPLSEFFLTVGRKLKFAVDAGSELAESSGLAPVNPPEYPVGGNVLRNGGGSTVAAVSPQPDLHDPTVPPTVTNAQGRRGRATRASTKVVRVSPREKAAKWVEYAKSMFDAWVDPRVERYFEEHPMHEVLDMRRFGRMFAGRRLQVVVEDRTARKCLLAINIEVGREGIRAIRVTRRPEPGHDFLLRADLPRMYVDPTLPPLARARETIKVFRTGVARLEGLGTILRLALFGLREALASKIR